MEGCLQQLKAKENTPLGIACTLVSACVGGIGLLRPREKEGRGNIRFGQWDASILWWNTSGVPFICPLQTLLPTLHSFISLTYRVDLDRACTRKHIILLLQITYWAHRLSFLLSYPNPSLFTSTPRKKVQEAQPVVRQTGLIQQFQIPQLWGKIMAPKPIWTFKMHLRI